MMATPTHYFLVVFLLMLTLSTAHGWDTDDLEIFDLVEEVNTNFYELFGIQQTATLSEIRKAYRQLSLQEHPDKSNAENAEERFRQVVAIYEVLKNPSKREKYDQVLVDGLPDWKQPVFYYRRARKMGLAELFVVLFIITTIGHYFVAWGVYVEQRLVVEDVLNSKKRKKKKKQSNTESICTEEEELDAIPTPKVLDLWPFQLSKYLYHTVYNIPNTIKTWKEETKRRKLEEEEELARLQLEEEEVEEVRRKPKKKVPVELPEYTNEMAAKYLVPTESNMQSAVEEKQTIRPDRGKGNWTDEELLLLAKAVNKFPGGTHQRWDKIAEMVGRSVNEVTAKTKETKGSYQMSLNASVQSTGYRTQSGSVKISDNIISQQDEAIVDGVNKVQDNGDSSTTMSGQQVRKRLVTSKIPQPANLSNISAKNSSTGETEMLNNGKGDSSDGSTVKKLREPWTQNQQTIFEWALKQYPKGTEARWEKVAEHIPGKSKEDCMLRFKELAFLVNQRKKVDQQAAQQK